MDDDKNLYRTWVRLGIYAGLAISQIAGNGSDAW